MAKPDKSRIRSFKLQEALNKLVEVNRGYNEEEMELFNIGLTMPYIVNFEDFIYPATYEDTNKILIKKNQIIIEVVPINLLEQYKLHINNKEFYLANKLIVNLRLYKYYAAKDKGLIFKSNSVYVINLNYYSVLNGGIGLCEDEVLDIFV